MKQTLNVYNFCGYMHRDPYSNFSHEALLAIFDYIEDLEDANGWEMEFSQTDIRLMFTEYKSEAEAIAQTNYDPIDWESKFIKLSNGGVVVVD